MVRIVNELYSRPASWDSKYTIVALPGARDDRAHLCYFTENWAQAELEPIIQALIELLDPRDGGTWDIRKFDKKYEIKRSRWRETNLVATTPEGLAEQLRQYYQRLRSH